MNTNSEKLARARKLIEDKKRALDERIEKKKEEERLKARQVEIEKQKKQIEKWKADKGIKSVKPKPKPKPEPIPKPVLQETLTFGNISSQFSQKLIDRYESPSDEESPDTVVPDIYPNPNTSQKSLEDSKESRASTPNTIIEYKQESSRNDSIVELKIESSKVSEDTEVSCIKREIKSDQSNDENSIFDEITNQMQKIQTEIENFDMEKEEQRKIVKQEILKAIFFHGFSGDRQEMYEFEEKNEDYDQTPSFHDEILFSEQMCRKWNSPIMKNFLRYDSGTKEYKEMHCKEYIAGSDATNLKSNQKAFQCSK
ncbi:unnamed protein product [Blepharisma stoltei]|uniref:Uncharacterized protein n=1 Tax=Blepharisma stoltei TaxID=1481888 RepID=A0AAU9JUL5_9CILI|nr:unnamed protein product [Blepharisma stoltei]